MKSTGQQSKKIPSSQSLNTREIVFKIAPSYLDNQSLDEIKTNIEGYVDDLNSIMTNNQINLRLFFNPDHLEVKNYYQSGTGGITTALRSDWKYVIYIFPDGDREGFAIKYAQDTDPNKLGFAVRKRMKFISRNDLNTNVSIRKGYFRFLDVATHELGHLFELGYSEYYSLTNKAKPFELVLEISRESHQEDPYFFKSNYWLARKNIMNDVMKGYAYSPNTKNPKESIKFSSFSRRLANMNLSGQIINSNLFKGMGFNTNLPPLPLGVKYVNNDVSHPYNKILFDNMNIAVNVKDVSGLGVAGCKVTNYKQINQGEGVEEISTGYTDGQGHATLIGRESDLNRSKLKNMIFFKAECDGHKTEVDAISFFDLQAYAFLGGGEFGDFHFNGEINFTVKGNDSCITKDTKKNVLHGQSVETFSKRIPPQTCAGVQRTFTCNNGSFGSAYNLNYFDSCQDNDYVSKEILFYVDRKFLSQQSEASIINNLRNYTNELEKIYLKTKLRFIFKPENIKFFEQPLFGVNAYSKYIGIDYKFAVQVTKVDKPTLDSALDVDNDSNLLWICNLNLMKIYDSEELTANNKISANQLLINQQSFKEQIRMLQLAVGFRLGLADYDNLAIFKDTTTILPNLSTGPLLGNIDSNIYWKYRKSVVPGSKGTSYSLHDQSILLVNSRLDNLSVVDLDSSSHNFVVPAERDYKKITTNFNITHRIINKSNFGINNCDVDLFNQAGQLLDSQKTDTTGSFTFSYAKYISHIDGDKWPFSSGKKSFLMVKARCANLKPCGELISSQDILFKSNNILQDRDSFYGFWGDKGIFKCLP